MCAPQDLARWHWWVPATLQVLRRVHPNSLADQWNKRFARRLVSGLLLVSVNGEEDHEEIMCLDCCTSTRWWFDNSFSPIFFLRGEIT